jgi:hypothetical protein
MCCEGAARGAKHRDAAHCERKIIDEFRSVKSCNTRLEAILCSVDQELDGG